MNDANIVYLELTQFEEGKVLRGGALVVDSTTEPLEFRCTTAVRPTVFQKILWGTRLSEHIAVELVGMPLLRSLKQPYSLIVVSTHSFLNVRAEFEVPVVLALKHSELAHFDFEPGGEAHDNKAPSENSQETAAKGDEGEDSDLLSTPSGRFEPIVLQAHKSFGDDVGAARELLKPVFQHHDVLEPFDRIIKALETVHEKEATEEG